MCSWPSLAAGLFGGLLFGIIGEGLGVGIGYICLSARGIPFVLDGGNVTLLLLGTLAGSALWGGIGVGLGAIVRSQVGGIIGLLVWGFVIENLLFAFVPSVGRFAPGRRRRLQGSSADDRRCRPWQVWCRCVGRRARRDGLGCTSRRDVA